MISITKDILKLKTNITCNILDIHNYNNILNINQYSYKFIIDDDIINFLLKEYDDGIYGILNYYININNDNNIEFNNIRFNGYTIRNKMNKNLIKILNEEKNELSEYGINENYGILTLFQKDATGTFGDKDIINLNQIYILPNGYIKSINDLEQEDIINDFNKLDILTKIYLFDDNKIKCLKTIDYEILDKKEDKNNNIFIIKNILDLNKKNEDNKREIERLIELTQYNKETKNKIIDMKYEDNIIKEIIDPCNQYIDYMKIFDLINDFEIINPIIDKDNNQYNKLWLIYYGNELDIIIKKYLDNFDLKEIDDRLIKHLSNIIEILLRYNLYINKKINNFSIPKKLYDLYPQKDKYTTQFSIFKQLTKQLYKSKYHLYIDDNNIISMYILLHLKYISLNNLIQNIIIQKIVPKIDY